MSRYRENDGYRDHNDRRFDNGYDSDSGVSGDGRIRGRPRNRVDWDDRADRRRGRENQRNSYQPWPDNRGGRYQRGPPRENRHFPAPRQNNNRQRRRDILGTRNTNQRQQDINSISRSLDSMSTQERTRIVEDRSCFIREQAEDPVTQKVNLVFINDDSTVGSTTVDTLNPRIPGCTITVKQTLEGEQSHFVRSVFEAKKSPMFKYFGSERSVFFHETALDPSSSIVYKHYAGQDLFCGGENGSNGLNLSLNHDWIHRGLIGKKFSNHLELNCSVSLFSYGMERIGVKNIAAAPFPITIFYIDDAGSEETWCNQKTFGSRDLNGDFIVSAIQIRDNNTFLAFVFFNAVMIPDWSPFRYLHENKVLRHAFEFINDKDLRRNPKGLPQWQHFIIPDAIREIMEKLILQFYSVIDKCGCSLTADRTKDNITIGLLPISRLFAEDSVFQRQFGLTERERENTLASSKYTPDFRSAASNAKAHRSWELDHDNKPKLPAKSHEVMIRDEIQRLADLRLQAPHTLRHVETQHAISFLKEKDEKKIAAECEKLLKVLPSLSKNTVYESHFSDMNTKTIAGDPELQQKISKQISNEYTEKMSKIQCKMDTQSIDLRAAQSQINQHQKDLAEAVNTVKVELTKKHAKDAQQLNERIIQLESIVERLVQGTKSKEPESVPEVGATSSRDAAALQFGIRNQVTKDIPASSNDPQTSQMDLN
ncbi:unnamed protein product [Oikopleura dioica]|uniref:Uncharacterized protein n=1 Tax=Oikopleura dioica TaxID=34765 RepID=E4X181_OIKDI|nr:unnamed protein product [Oikopleura dioica]